MSTLRILRPKQRWSLSPRTALPAGLLYRLFRPQSKFTVVLDGHPIGKLGNEQQSVFEVEPGKHELHMRFVRLRRSEKLRMFLKAGEERSFICGVSGMGWPTLREASQEEVATIGELRIPGDPIAPRPRGMPPTTD